MNFVSVLQKKSFRSRKKPLSSVKKCEFKKLSSTVMSSRVQKHSYDTDPGVTIEFHACKSRNFGEVDIDTNRTALCSTDVHFGCYILL